MATKKRSSIPLADTGIDWTKPAGEFIPSQKDVAPAEEQAGSGMLRRTLGDTAVSAVKSAIGVPETLVGMADMVTGGRAGKLVQDAGVDFKAANEVADTLYSPEYQAASKKVQGADGIVDTLRAAFENPSTIYHGAVTSLGSMLTGAPVGKAAMLAGTTMAGRAAIAAAPAAERGAMLAATTRTPGWVAGALSEGASSAGQNLEQVRQGTANGLLTAEQIGVIGASGALTAGITAVAGRVANKLGIGDINQMIAGAQRAGPEVQKGLARTLAEGFATEGLLQEFPQSWQEQVAQNIATGKPWADGAANAAVMGGLSGGLLGAGAAPFGRGEAAPVVDPGAAIRATKQPEGGPMTRAANAAIEAQAQAADAGMQSLPTLSSEQEQAALAAIEAQGGKDAKGLRQFAAAANSAAGARPTPTAQPGQGMPATGQSTGPSATVVDAPFSDRLLTLREQLGDEATRQALRAQFGDDALNQAAYYAGIADRPDVQLPNRTRDNMLALAERMVSMALLKPINRPGVESDSTQAAQLEGPGAGPAQIGLDTTMTGRMRVDAAGNAAPETRADAINTQQAAAGMGADERQARKASAVNADPAPAADPKPAGQPALGYDTTPTGRMRAGSDGVAPETAADAINTRQAQGERDAEAQRKADLGLTPDVQAVQDRNAQGRAMPGDLLNPKGEPFKHERAAITAQKKAKGGAVLQVAGGWVVRPESATVEPANAKGQETAAVPPAPVAPAQQEGTDRAGAAPAEAATSGSAGPAGRDSAGVEADGLKAGDRVSVLNGKGEARHTGKFLGKNDAGTGARVELAGGEVVTVVAGRVRKIEPATAEPSPATAPATGEPGNAAAPVEADSGSAAPAPTAAKPEKAVDRRNRLKAEREAKDAPADGMQKALAELHFVVTNRADPKTGKYPPIDQLRFNAAVRTAKASGIEVSTQVGSSGTVVWSFTTPAGDGYSAYLEKSGKGTWMAQKRAPEAAQKPAPAAPSANTLVTEDAAEKARAIIKAKLRGNTLNSGIDPELLQAGITLAAYHVERGARKFAAYARAMVDDLGDVVKPYLQSWYMAMRSDPTYAAMRADMDKASAVEDLDVDEVLAGGAPAAPNAPAPVEAPRSMMKPGFDSDAWQKERDDRIKVSREAGNTHLDQVPAYVETMRGKDVYYVHDTKVRGRILTVDNNGNVYVEWLDKYSQDKEGATPMKMGKRQVMQSSLGPRDLKDYVSGKPQEPNEAARPQAQAAGAEGTAPAAAPAPAAPAVVPGAGPAAVESGGLTPGKRQELQDARQMVEDMIATKRANREAVPDAWVKRLADISAQQRGEKADDGAVYSLEVEGHPLYDSRPVLRNLVPIKVSSVADAQRKLDNALDLERKVATEFYGAQQAMRAAKTAAQKKAAQARLTALNNQGWDADSLKDLRDTTIGELSRLLDTATERFGAATPNAEAPVQAAPRGAEAAPVAPAPDAERYAAGRALTKEQRKQVLDSLVDVYKAKGADREMKGQGRDGNERYGYVHSPELFEKSDITGAMVRYYVTLPDGRRAHPSELFPDYTQSDIEAVMAKREADEKADRDNQAWAEGQADKFGKPTIAEAEASWKERNKGVSGNDPLRNWRTGQQYTLVPMEKGGKFYSVRNDDAALMGRLERGGWKRAGAVPDADDYLTQLFGTPAEQAASQERLMASIAQRKQDTERVRSAIGAEKKRAQADYDDWSSRTYKRNKTQVDLQGDGPSNQGSMSIGAINESRRRNAMEALSQELKALDKLGAAVATDSGAEQFMGAMRDLYARAEKIAADGNGLFKTPGEQFQYMLLDDLKVRGPAGKGNVTSNGLSKAVLSAVKPEAATPERTPKAQAVKEALAGTRMVMGERVDALLAEDEAEVRAAIAAAAPESEPAKPTPDLQTPPAEQAAAILNAAAEPPKGRERLDVLKDVKAGAITPEEVAAAFPPAGEVAAVEPVAESALVQAAAEPATKPDAAPTEPAPMPAVGGISMSLAQQAHSGTSFVPERRAEQERDSFKGALKDAWDRAARIAGTDPAAIARITEVFADVADGYRARYTATLQARSRVMSSMITGAARFPVERNRKRLETERKRAEEASEFLARGIKRLIRAARGPIDNSPESELERVRLNLSQREELQETMKAANAALRKDDDAALEDLGFTAEQIADLKKGSKWDRGFPAYRLTNNNAEIRRLRERLQSAEERMAAAQAGPVEEERQGVKIVEDATDDRLRLIFDGKPSEAVREDLKANGFKWSPKNDAWQRQLTDNARYAAKQVLDKHYPQTRADDAGNVAMFSRAEAQQQPASDRRQAVEALVQQIAGRWANAPEVVVVNSMDDPRVPEAVRRDEQTQQSKASAGAPEGFFHGGKVYLVAPQLGGDADVIRVLFHESLGHFGLRGTFGADLGAILDRVAILNASKVRAKAKQYGLDYDKASDRRAAAEEVLADMAQRTPELGWGKKAVVAVRAWLRQHVPGFRQMALSDDEIVRSYILPARAFVQRGGPGSGGGGGVAFSRSTVADKMPAGSKLSAQDLVDAKGGVFDFNRLGVTTQDRLRTVMDGTRPFWLGTLTRDQLADVYGKEIPPVREYDDLTRQMENQRSKIAQDAADIYDEWAKLPAEVNDRLSRLMLDATVNSVHPDQEFSGAAEAKDVHQRLAAEWAKLTPEAQAVYQKVKQFHLATLTQLRDGLEERITRQVEAGQARAAALTKIRQTFDSYLGNGPYFPLSRFGDFLVVAKREDGERVVAAYATAGEQAAAARTLEADGFTVKLKTAKTYSRETDGSAGKFIGDVLMSLEKLDMADATVGGEASGLKTKLMDDVNQLFIKALPDLSYRKHFAHRKNVPGFSSDMMRGFASSSFHAASHIARVNHGDKMTFALQDAYAAIESAPEGDFNLHSQVLNELTKRHDAALNPNTHPITSMLNQVGFVMYLGMSPAAGLINMLQTVMVTMPHLGARFGFARANRSLAKAMSDIVAGAKANSKNGWNAAESTKLTETERAMMRELQDEGVIDLTQAHDLASATGLDSGNVARSKAAFAMARAMKIVGWTFHIPEVMNRQVSALSAYRLAMEKHGDAEKAKDEAREAIKRTHFDYSASNRARFMQGNIARVALQFKQYSQNMTYLLGRAMHQALQGESAEVRSIARRQLVATLAVTWAMAGTLGLPGLGAVGGLIAAMIGAAGGDDEPYDWKVEFRNLMADVAGKQMGEVIAHGIPRALMPWDISNRVGLGDLWFRDGGREGQKPREAFATDMVSILGPTFGALLGFYTAADHMARGNWSKAVEGMVPKALRDPIKAAREGTEGVTSAAGSPLMDLTAAEVIGQLLGFTPARKSEMFEARNAVMNTKTVLDEKRQALIDKMVKARMDRDTDAIAGLAKDIGAFNSRNPQFKIAPSAIIKSMAAKRRNAANTEAGITLPKSKDVLRDIGRFAVTE